MSDTEKNKLREELGLDRSLPEQYVSWLKDMLHGDMGESYVSGKPVFQTFLSKLPATVSLTAASALLTVLLSVPLGILSALRQNHVADYVIRFLSFIGNSLPNFFVALLLIWFFALKLGWLPVLGQTGDARSMILPTLTLGIAMTSKYTRQVRSAVLEELQKDYVLGARARGIRESHILLFDVLKSSMPSLMTLLALSIGNLLGGTAIVESIFMWDGIGKMAVDAINMRDYPVIQAYVVWMAFIYMGINLLADILSYFLDPGMRLGSKMQEK